MSTFYSCDKTFGGETQDCSVPGLRGGRQGFVSAHFQTKLRRETIMKQFYGEKVFSESTEPTIQETLEKFGWTWDSWKLFLTPTKSCKVFVCQSTIIILQVEYDSPPLHYITWNSFFYFPLAENSHLLMVKVLASFLAAVQQLICGKRLESCGKKVKYLVDGRSLPLLSGTLDIGRAAAVKCTTLHLPICILSCWTNCRGF